MRGKCLGFCLLFICLFYLFAVLRNVCNTSGILIPHIQHIHIEYLQTLLIMFKSFSLACCCCLFSLLFSLLSFCRLHTYNIHIDTNKHRSPYPVYGCFLFAGTAKHNDDDDDDVEREKNTNTRILLNYVDSRMKRHKLSP